MDGSGNGVRKGKGGCRELGCSIGKMNEESRIGGGGCLDLGSKCG